MRQSIKVNKCLGITNSGELVMVNDFFFHDESFQGVTGSSFVPISQEEIDERNDLEFITENYGYLWSEAVSAGLTTVSEKDYMQGLIDSARFNEGEFLGHDTSYIYHIPELIKKEHFPDAETFECIAGGRCFPENDMKIIFDQDFFDAVAAFEAGELPLEAIADLLQLEIKGGK